MDEELIDFITDETFDLNIEDVSHEIEAEDSEISTSYEEIVEMVEAEAIEEIQISVEEGMGWSGGDNTRHYSLYGREEPDQHPIGAITGLRQELDQIEALQTVYSDKKQQADYYMWYDENLLLENREGLFVSVYQTTNHIKICNETSDVFGVTVAEAGFVGGQEYVQAENGTKTGRDRKYGLVAYSGLVSVRCGETIKVGDYIVPNNRGEAKKSNGDYGYLVTALSKVGDTQYAIISLSIPSTLAKNIADDIQYLSEHMSNAETDIISINNVANSAYAHADKLMKEFENNVIVVDNEINKIKDDIGSTNGRIDKLNESSSVHNVDIATLKQGVADLDTYAKDVQTEANTRADGLSAEISKITNTLMPLRQWYDEEAGITSYKYIDQKIQDGIATSYDIDECLTKSEEITRALISSAKGIESLTQKISNYTVGEYSQAYGLTLEQAQSVLTRKEDEEKIIYIPTVSHNEWYHDSYTQTFTKSFVYTWNNELWVESDTPIVTFSDSPVGSDGTYWVVITNDNNDVVIEDKAYRKNYLYLKEDGVWVEKAKVEVNSLSRAVSIIHQVANELAFEVTNARGDAATISARLDSEGAKTSMIASVVTDEKLTEPAGIYNTLEELETAEVLNDGAYYCVKENIPFDVYQWDEKQNKFIKQESIKYDGVNYCKVNTASIIGAVNSEGKSSILLNADKINFEGYATFLSTDGNGTITAINGNGITTGCITANSYVESNGEQGLQINLDDGTFDSPNFKIYEDGSVETTGTIYATSGEIGGCEIVDGQLTANTLSAISADLGLVEAGAIQSKGYVADQTGFRISCDDNMIDSKYFKVTKDGEITATSGTIGGFGIGEHTLSSGGKIDLNGTEEENNAKGVNHTVGICSESGHGPWAIWAGEGKFGDKPFRVGHDGSLHATQATIQGHIDATSGRFADGCTIGDFTITNGSLISDCIQLNSEVIYFPTQAVFNLSNDVKIFNENNGNVSYIATMGDRDFEVKNMGGAGIRFKADPKDQQVTLNVILGQFSVSEKTHTTDLGEGYTNTQIFRTLNVPYTISSGAVLHAPEHFDLYYRIREKYNGGIFGVGAYDEYKTVKIGVDIPALQSSGNLTFTIDARTSTSVQFTCYGVCKTESSTNADYSMNAITFSVLSINASNNILYSLGSFCPNVPEGSSNITNYLLGDDNHVWKGIVTNTSPKIISDARQKKEIKPIEEKFDIFFNELKPVSFKYINGESDRNHLGFIAQDIETSLSDAGIDTKDFAGICIGNDENKTYTLRYEEFIPLNTLEIQKLKKRVTELEEIVNELKTQITQQSDYNQQD